MVKVVERLYNYHRYCEGCFAILLYDNEDIIQDSPFDYIICPKCGETNFI